MKKNKFIPVSKRAAAGFAFAVLLAAAPLETYAAQQTYTVTYSPGKIGEFTDSLKAACEAAGGTVSGKTGSIKVPVAAGESCPVVPDVGDVQIKEEYQGKYVIDAEAMNTVRGEISGQEGSVTQSDSYVVDYEALVNGVTYKIEFVDEESGEELASPIIVQGNLDQVVPYTAKIIEGYTVTGESVQSMTLSAGDNTMTFTYSRNEEAVPPQTQIVETPGDTITQTVTVPGENTTVTEYQGAAAGTTTGTAGTGTAAGTTGTGTATGTAGTGAGTTAGTGTPAAGAGTGTDTGAADTTAAGTAGTGTADGTAAGGNEVLPGEEVPQGNLNLDENQNDADTAETQEQEGASEIEDEEVPLAQTDLEEEDSQGGTSAVPFVIAGVVVVAAGAGGALYYLKRKR